MSELPLEEVPAASDAVHQAAGGRVIHITEGGQRIAAIVPESVLRALQAAEDAEDAAEADAAFDEPGEDIPWEQVKAEL
jgi:antitoxin Phd